MMRRTLVMLRASVRQLLPRPELFAPAALLLAALELSWLAIQQVPLLAGPVGDRLLASRDLLLLVFLAAHGVLRVLTTHPFFSRDYLKWLRQTPWRSPLPLPLGPIHLNVADGAFVVAVALLFADGRVLVGLAWPRPDVLLGIYVFLAFYAGTLAVALWLTGPRSFGYLAGTLLSGSVAYGLSWRPEGLMLLALAVVVVLFGLKLSWQGYPWEEAVEWMDEIAANRRARRRLQAGVVQFEESPLTPAQIPPAELGWPFAVCSPHMPRRRISRLEKTLALALAGAWFAGLLRPLPEELAQVCLAFGAMYGGIMSLLCRAVIYGANHSPPISLLGRLVTGRLIIPSYDVVILGHVLTLIAPAVVAGVGLLLPVPLSIVAGLTIVSGPVAAVACGPAPERWKLTARARLTPGRLNRQAFEELH